MVVCCSQGYEQENRIMRKLEQKVAKFLLSPALRGLYVVGPEFEHTPRTLCIYNTYKLHKFLFFNTILANSTFFNNIRAHTNELISPLRYNCLRVLFAQQACYSLNLLCYPILSHPQYTKLFVTIGYVKNQIIAAAKTANIYSKNFSV